VLFFGVCAINNTLFPKNLFSHIFLSHLRFHFIIMRLFLYPFFILMLSFAASPLFAQTQSIGTISGKLVDAKNAPVSYATVTLLRVDSTVAGGDLSKDDGSFSISPTGVGSFRLRIEAMGVATKYVNVTVTEQDAEKKLGNIKLAESENRLKDVNIVGEKPIMELKVDKKVFNVDKNTTTAGGSATDVLQNVPAVSVDADGNVSLRGKSDVTILIDGKPATMFGSDVTAALQSLPAGSIESVEVITNPSAKYDAQGTGGIINIITKKDGRFGMNGTATVGAGTNDKYNGNLGLNARKGKWNAFLNSSYRTNNTYNDVITDRTDKRLTGLDTQSYHTFEHVPRKFGGFFNTIGASYDPNKYNSITVTQNFNKMGFSFKDYSDYKVFSDPNQEGVPAYIQNRYTDFGVDLFSSSSAIDYKRKFKKKDEELSIDATYAYTDISRRQDYRTIVAPDSLYQHSPAGGHNTSFNTWADFTDPLFTKNGKLGMGFKSQFFNFFSANNPLKHHGVNGADSSDYSLLSNYSYSQQTHAVYVNWNDQIGKFSYQAGLRAEDAVYDGNGRFSKDNIQAPTDTSFHNSFLSFFPSAFISYQIAEQQSIYLNYSRRTNRPGFRQLLPFVDLSNPSTVSVGNPDLIPEFINNMEFSYTRADKKGNNFIVSAYYAHTANLMEKVTRPITADEATKYNVSQSNLYSQPVNIASGATYGLEGTGHFQLLPIWDATVNLNYFQNQLLIGNIDTVYKKYLTDNSGSSWFGKVNTNIKLPKNFSIQVNANYESPKVITQGNLKETYWVDVAVRKNFWKNKATLILNCSDIFNTHVAVTNYNLAFYDQTINRIRETRTGNITFTYRFGKTDLGKDKPGGGAQSGEGKRSKKDKKADKPSDEDREKNLKQGDDNDQPGNGGGDKGPKKEGGGGSGASH
jgi:iron complex outermembrane recepter protein